MLVIAEVVQATWLTDAQVRGLQRWASTNIDRLTTEPILPMVVSAFVVGGRLAMWPALVLLGSATSEWRPGARRTAVLLASGHVIGTLVSEGLLWWRIRAGHVGESARHMIDVGVSYVAVAALVAGIGAGLVRGRSGRPVGGRIAAGAACAASLAVLLPRLLSGLRGLSVAAVGHLTATLAAGIIGVVLVVRLDEQAWEPGRHDGVPGLT